MAWAERVLRSWLSIIIMLPVSSVTLDTLFCVASATNGSSGCSLRVPLSTLAAKPHGCVGLTYALSLLLFSHFVPYTMKYNLLPSTHLSAPCYNYCHQISKDGFISQLEYLNDKDPRLNIRLPKKNYKNGDYLIDD